MRMSVRKNKMGIGIDRGEGEGPEKIFPGWPTERSTVRCVSYHSRSSLQCACMELEQVECVF